MSSETSHYSLYPTMCSALDILSAVKIVKRGIFDPKPEVLEEANVRTEAEIVVAYKDNAIKYVDASYLGGMITKKVPDREGLLAIVQDALSSNSNISSFSLFATPKDYPGKLTCKDYVSPGIGALYFLKYEKQLENGQVDWVFVRTGPFLCSRFF
ncbi:MAG: hypothetical protein Q8O89_02495 [Nanoarchaeota archaeon]|nr:hypothetical protein [Nanoarchaeota archaeon]